VLGLGMLLLSLVVERLVKPIRELSEVTGASWRTVT